MQYNIYGGEDYTGHIGARNIVNDILVRVKDSLFTTKSYFCVLVLEPGANTSSLALELAYKLFALDDALTFV